MSRPQRISGQNPRQTTSKSKCSILKERSNVGPDNHTIYRGGAHRGQWPPDICKRQMVDRLGCCGRVEEDAQLVAISCRLRQFVGGKRNDHHSKKKQAQSGQAKLSPSAPPTTYRRPRHHRYGTGRIDFGQVDKNA